MSTLIEQLKKDVAELELKHGSEHPFVKDLKEQLRASMENGDKSTQEVYRLQATSASPASETSYPEEDGMARIAKYRHQNAQMLGRKGK